MGKKRFRNQYVIDRAREPEPPTDPTSFPFDVTRKSGVPQVRPGIELNELMLDSPGTSVRGKHPTKDAEFRRRNLAEDGLRGQYPDEFPRLVAILDLKNATEQDKADAYERLFAVRSAEAVPPLVSHWYLLPTTINKAQIADWCFAQIEKAPTAQLCVKMIDAGWRVEEARTLLNGLYDPLAGDIPTENRPAESRFADALYAIEHRDWLPRRMNPEEPKALSQNVIDWSFREIERTPTFEACTALLDARWRGYDAVHLLRRIDPARTVEVLVSRIKRAWWWQNSTVEPESSTALRDRRNLADLLDSFLPDNLPLPESTEEILKSPWLFNHRSLLWAIDQLRLQRNSAALFASMSDQMSPGELAPPPGTSGSYDVVRQGCASALVELHGLSLIVRGLVDQTNWVISRATPNPDFTSPSWDKRRDAALATGIAPALLSLVDNDTGGCRTWADQALRTSPPTTIEVGILLKDQREWWRDAAVNALDTSDTSAVEMLFIALQDDSLSVRQNAWTRLTAVAPQREPDILIDMLDYKYPLYTRTEIHKKLRGFGRAAAAPLLAALQRGSSSAAREDVRPS